MTKKQPEKQSVTTTNGATAKVAEEALKASQSQPKAEVVGVTEEGKKVVKLNAESYEKWASRINKPRASSEESELKPRLTHKPRDARESDGYYVPRKLTFDVLGKEFRTPQQNIELLTREMNKHLAKEAQVLEPVYHAPSYSMKFRIASRPITEVVRFDVRSEISASDFLKAFGLKPEAFKA